MRAWRRTGANRPWQNSFAEGVIGRFDEKASIQVIVVNERHLRPLLHTHLLFCLSASSGHEISQLRIEKRETEARSEH